MPVFAAAVPNTDGRIETTRVFNFGGGFEPEQTYGSEWQFDAEASLKIVDTLELFVGGVNLLDEYPDESSADINSFGNLPYDVLSPLGFQGRYVYGGARITL
jgi:iron complex outermembrane receptor protein